MLASILNTSFCASCVDNCVESLVYKTASLHFVLLLLLLLLLFPSPCIELYYKLEKWTVLGLNDRLMQEGPYVGFAPRSVSLTFGRRMVRLP